MSSHAKRLVDRARELNYLVKSGEIPKTDGIVEADRDYILLCQVEVHAND